MPRESAVEILVCKPDPTIPQDQKGVHENLWLKKRFNQYVSIGVYLDGSDLKYYFFQDGDSNPKIYSSLLELKQDLPTGLENIFDNTPELFVMGHGHGGKYGLGNVHGASEEIYGADFDKIITDFEATLSVQHDEVFVMLEACNTDNLALAAAERQEKTFLERVSANHPTMTFSGTGPWDPNDPETGYRASGGFPTLNVPITAMGGGVWKYGESVIFYHGNAQVVVKKSLFATTETAKELKINTIAYAREILKQTALGDDAKEAIIKNICANRHILKIADLKNVSDFPQGEFEDQEISRLATEEKRILEKEKNNYIVRVQTILARVASGEKFTDRDVLVIALGLKDLSVFNGHEDCRDAIFSNRALLQLVMVSCGKVLIGAPSNDDLIDLLLSHGVDINSVDENGMTATHYAAQNFYNYRKEPLHLVRKLLDCGANLGAQDKVGRTPLMLATLHSQKSIVMGGASLVKLLEQKQQIEAVENGLQRRRQVAGVTPKNILTRMRELHVPNASITIIKDGEIAWSRNYDSAAHTAVDQDAMGHAPVFQAGSISKTVNAVLTMKLLVETGKIKLDDDLTAQLNAMGIVNNSGKPITLAQLLSHTAGTTVHGFAGYPTSAQTIPTTTEILAGRAELKVYGRHAPEVKDTHTPNTAPVEVVDEPGKECVYSGGGTTIIQRLIEMQYPGRSYASLVEEHIFRPLGMTQSTFELQRPGASVAHIQSGHEHDGTAMAGGWRLHPESAAAGLWSTTSDLAKFAIAIHKMSLDQVEQPILKKETVHQMLVRQPNSGFGLGFEVSGDGGEISFGHGGATIGYRADYIFFPQTGMGAVILTNSENGNQLMEGIYCSIAKNYGWTRRGTEVLQPVSLTGAVLQKCVGEFVSPDGMVFTSKIVAGQLQLTLPNFARKERAELTFVPLSETKFFCVEYQFEVTFDGDYREMTFMDGMQSRRKEPVSSQTDTADLSQRVELQAGDVSATASEDTERDRRSVSALHLTGFMACRDHVSESEDKQASSADKQVVDDGVLRNV